MSKEQQQGFWGCVVLVGIAVLIGVGLRSKSFVQFLVIGAAAVGVLVAAIWSLGGFLKEGFWSKLLGLWWGAWAVWLAIAVGGFLVTGDYNNAAQRLGIKATATPEATLVAAATAQPTSTPMPQPTSTPVPTRTPVAIAIPASAQTPWYLADRSMAKPLSKQIESWRLYLGVVLGLQYLMSVYIAVRTKQRHMGRNLIVGILSLLLVFTKLGEWIYKIVLWVFGWGLVGKIVAVILALLTGVVGTGSITAYIIAGYIYHDMQVMELCVLPSAIVAFLTLFIALRHAGGKKYLPLP